MLPETQNVYTRFAMESYLRNADHNFHVSLSLGYCNNCRAISSVGGSYTIFEGNDCNGSHYGIVNSPEKCTSCHTGNFVKVSNYDASELRKIYGGKTPEIILDGIDAGLNRMNFPGLYNEQLPAVAQKWKGLSKQEKLKQINQLLRLQEKRAAAKRKVDNLEKVLTG